MLPCFVFRYDIFILRNDLFHNYLECARVALLNESMHLCNLLRVTTLLVHNGKRIFRATRRNIATTHHCDKSDECLRGDAPKSTTSSFDK